MAKLDERIGFLGGGNMAFAIGYGLINRGIIKPAQVVVSGPNLSNLERWRLLGANITEDNGVTVTKCDIIFICVKPHLLHTCASQVEGSIDRVVCDKDKLFVSVLAGISLDQLELAFSFMNNLKIIRSMPNTPMQVGEGCTVYTPGRYVTTQDLEKTHLILNSLGIAQQVPEKWINAVAAMAGSGPAYVFTVIEAMADGAVKQGIPRQMALQFAAQTVLGSAKTVIQTEKHPAVLRDEVCSPGGSTIVGMHELEKIGIRNAFINAIEKAAERNQELGNFKK
ncbi:uncharacterized protein LOC116352093 [Contarinia nasturtii]|uniref:uncharacterized protein LOC116352093 n=1 Tax=Contarinia nasturtii TaxID=265458 RepID=UPI0012D48936|nr:uncharacterized protein LOC116352093 [Contarinia nasturtii]XP_031640246.1 uncharacterized protein LOC116352093 [Contarinia nasturtii]